MRSLGSTHPFDIEAAKARLADKGGYEVVHESAGIEIGVYVLVAPEPDRQQPHADDEVYVVLDGHGHPRGRRQRRSSSTRGTQCSCRRAPTTASPGTRS